VDVKQMRYLGQLLLWIGFLAGAFVSLSRLEQDGSKWSTIPWVWYAVSMGVGIAGIMLLRVATRELDADDAKTDAEYSVIQQSLAKIAEIVERLCEEREHVPSQVLRCIDDECVEPLADFADARQALVKRFGLAVYADVMTEFAAAERYVNRSWSAAADGYVDEVASSLKRALEHLRRAQGLLVAAEGQAS
jgi:hypothetical protein